jgi:glycosyltransferase involved in cell wall biosynthesis
MMDPAAAPLTTPAEPQAPVAGLVSVTIVIYNGAREVAQAIDSVLGQNYPTVEVIAVDDGSTDGTWDVLQSYGNRIRAVRQRNGGLPAARNTGLRHARGEFIALMDHDDLCMPERLSVQVAFLHAHPEVGLCGSDFSAFNENGPIEPSHIATYYSQYARVRGRPEALYPHSSTLDISPCLPQPSPVPPCLVATYQGDVYERIACGNFVHPPTVMVRADVLRRAGLFDPDARTMCDWDWLVRVACVSHIGHIHRALLDYRRSATQMSAPEQRPRGSLDAFHVARRIRKSDPTLMQRCGPALMEMLGRSATDAAYANAEVDPFLALRCLGLAVFCYQVINTTGLRALLRALLPNELLNLIRRFKPAATRQA